MPWVQPLHVAWNQISKITYFQNKQQTQTFIFFPGYEYKGIDGLLTNFHLPKSSLFILVAAMIGLKNIQDIYQHAIENDYRFFSFGDAMLIS